MQLNAQDFQNLLNAVDALEREDSTSGLMATMLGAMVVTKENRDEFFREEKRLAAERQANAQVRREQAILLKAKLIAMRDSATASELTTVK